MENTTEAPKWFYRSGAEYTKTNVLNPNLKTGRAVYGEILCCGRCGGMGGSQEWAHTGWTCFKCTGTGRDSYRETPLYTAERLAKLNATDEKRQVKKIAKSLLVLAQKAELLATMRAEFLAQHGSAIAAIEANAENNPFLADLLRKFQNYGSLSDRQIEASTLAIEKLAALAVTRYVGIVGERHEFTLTVEYVHVPERVPYGQRRFPGVPPCIYLCRDEQGNRIVYRGSSDNFLLKGETGRIAARVESHEEFRGEMQTKISRPKVIETLVSQEMLAA